METSDGQTTWLTTQHTYMSAIRLRTRWPRERCEITQKAMERITMYLPTSHGGLARLGHHLPWRRHLAVTRMKLIIPAFHWRNSTTCATLWAEIHYCCAIFANNCPPCATKAEYHCNIPILLANSWNCRQGTDCITKRIETQATLTTILYRIDHT